MAEGQQRGMTIRKEISLGEIAMVVSLSITVMAGAIYLDRRVTENSKEIEQLHTADGALEKAMNIGFENLRMEDRRQAERLTRVQESIDTQLRRLDQKMDKVIDRLIEDGT